MKNYYLLLVFIGLLGVQGTLAQAPTVTALSPTRNLRNASATTNVAITFSQPISSGTATLGSLRVFSQQRGGQLRNGMRGITSASGNTLSFDPTNNFRPGETVFTTVTPAAQSSEGVNLDRGQVHQFTVAVGGTGRGNFTSPATNPNPGTGNGTRAVATGDLDGDGDLDFVNANFGNSTVSVRLNNGSGNFTAPPTNPNPSVGFSPYSIAVGDVDGDGDLDFVTGNFGNNTASVRFNNGSGNFTAPATNPNPAVGSAPYDIALGDVDGDGDLDLLTANQGASTVSVRLNDGTGNFTPPATNPNPGVRSSPYGLALGDLDGDGDLDFVATSSTNTVSVRLNDGTGNFTTPAINPNPAVASSAKIALGDLDGDGDLDFIATSGPNTVSVQLNDGTGNFIPHPTNPTPSVRATPFQLALGDVDGDGDLDLVTTCGITNNNVSIRLNDGTGSFTAPSVNQDPSVGNGPICVALGDVDGDNDLDLLTANTGNATVSVRLNQPSPPSIVGLAATPNPVCTGSPLTVTATVGNISASYSYTLTNGSSPVSATTTSTAFSQTLTASGSGSQSFTLTVSSGGQLVTATTSLTVGTLSTANLTNNGPLTCAQTSVTLTASSGGSSYTFTNGSGTVLAGSGNTRVVNSPGSYSVTVANAGGCVSRTSTSVLSNTTEITTSNPATSSVNINTPFSQSFTASGGVAPYSFSIASGSLPNGLNLNTSGVLSGTPTQSGSFSITVQVTDANGCFDLGPVYVLTVNEAPATQPIRYVKQGGVGDGTSWDNASGDLQSQINIAGAQQVWVAAGTYKPSGDANTGREVSFTLKNGVAIYGGFADNEMNLSQRPPVNPITGPDGASHPSSSTLSGDIGRVGDNSDNCYHVINNPGGLTSTAVLDGFVITGGNADGGSSQDYGGGMSNVKSSPALTNCSFQANTAAGPGGGIYNGNSSPTLTNCSFQANTAANGGGIFNESSSPALTNCSFQGNTASNGGGIFSNTNNSTLTNCSFQANTAAYNGGGMYNFYGSPALTNCSFQANSASQSGGGMYNDNSSLALTNCVLFGNGGANTVVNTNNSSIRAGYSLFDATVTGYTGSNNLTTTISPFISATSTQLNGCAPAINAGLNSASGLTGITTDLAGNPRFFNNGVVDMGAYEYQANPTVISVSNPSVMTATVGVGFSQTFIALGGSSPYSFSIVSSNLPASLTLATSGVLSGTPTQAGSYSVLVRASDANGCVGVASTAYNLTVNPVVSAPFAITGVTTISCTPILPNRFSLSFTPQYSGLNGQPISFQVTNELLPTSEPGPYTLQLYTDNPIITLKATQTGTPIEASFAYNWLDACRTSQATNTPPTLVTPIASQTATAGTYFTFVIPDGTFTDAETPLSLRLSATGLPPGLSFAGATLSGVPSTTVGSPVSLTITATDPGNLSVSTSFLLTLSPTTNTPPPTQPFAITGVTTLSCTPVADRINISFAPNYVGLNGQAVAFQIVNELAPTTDPAPYSLTLYRDNSVLSLKANQTESIQQASFSYNWLAACANLGQDNTPPRVNSPVANQTATVGQGFSLNLSNTFADQETPNSLTLTATGLPNGLILTNTLLSGTPSVSGVATVTLTATDPGSLSTSTRFTITVSPASSTTVSPPPSDVFSITGVTTVSCEVLSSGERKLTFTPQYAGLTGQPLSFSVVNELLPTSNPGPYVLNLYTDNPVITLKATQSGTAGEASFSYHWLSACGPGSPRQGVPESETPLQVRVLGNPVEGSSAEIEISGVLGQKVQIELVDIQGQLYHQQTLDQAGRVDRVLIPVGDRAKFFLVRVSSGSQRLTIKLIRL